MSNGHSSLDRLNSPVASSNDVSMQLEHCLSRPVNTGALISSDQKDGPSAFLVETGIVAVFTVSGSTPPTCVALAGPGFLLETEAGSDFNYRAMGPVTLFTVPAALIEHAVQS